MIFVLLLGLLSVLAHVFGRAEPLSFIVAFFILKWVPYVILRDELFFITWILIASILLDLIWIVFSSHNVSQINLLNMTEATIITYILLCVKVLYLVYLLIF